MTFSISAPLLELTRLAAISPARINALMETRLARGTEARMRPGDHYPSTLKRRTGVSVVALARRNRHLLLTVENRHPFWIYAEHSRNTCMLALPVEIPQTALSASVGMQVGRLVETGTPVDLVKIAGVSGTSGRTVLELTPIWTRV